MYDQDPPPKRGPFHWLIGQSFESVVSPHTAKLKKDKSNLNIMQSYYKHRAAAVDEQIALWTEEIEKSDTELASLLKQRQKVEQSLKQQRAYWYTPDIRNLPGALIGHIPVIGTVYTAYDLTSRGYQYWQDTNKLNQTNVDIDTWKGYTKATEQALQSSKDDKLKITMKLMACKKQIDNIDNALSKTIFGKE